MKEITIQIPDDCELVKEGDAYKIRELSYPRSWEEYCKMYSNIKSEYYINFNSQLIITSEGKYRNHTNDRNLLSSKEEAEAFLALIQLRRLREAWIKHFKSNWITNNCCRIAVTKDDNICVIETDLNSSLSFPNIGIAEHFLTTFKDLLEKAKILL